MSQEEATAILVAGMHRSGTSALTGALGAVGIALGKRLLAPGSDNPKGYWEHEDAVGIHERLLASLGRHWDDVRALPENWQVSEAARTASAEIGELISRDFAQSAVWAIKDPRICRFLPLWIEATRQLRIRPVVLFVARRPSEVAASIRTRNHWAPPIGELLWLRHVLEAEAASRELQRATVVYDDLLADPVGTVSVVLNRLGILQHKSDSAGERGALKRLVDVSDRHHRHTEATESSSGFGAIAQTTYEALANTAHGGDTWPALQECAARFDELWQTFGAPVEAVADMAHQIRLKEGSAQLEILELSSKLNAQIQWSEQAVAIRSELRAEYQLALDAVVAGRERLASELESMSSAVAQERAGFVAVREALAAERERLAGELKSVSSAVAQERAEFAVAREALAAERDRLAGELEAATARSELEHQSHEMRLHELAERYDAGKEALRAARTEVVSLNTLVVELHQSLSWRITRPLRILGKFFRAISVRGKR